MKRAYKSLLLLFSIFFMTAFSAIDMQAQSANSGFEGTWVLDSVQIKEVGPDNIVEKTLPGDNNDFYGSRMWQLTLGSDGKLSYMDKSGQNTSSIPYTIKNKNGNAATLITDSTGDVEKKIQLLSENTMLVTQSFTIMGVNMENIDITWKMYYSKIK